MVGRQSKIRKRNPLVDEELLEGDIETQECDNKDMEELDDEIALLEAKESGSRRTDPTAPCESIPAKKTIFKCSWDDCEMILEC